MVLLGPPTMRYSLQFSPNTDHAVVTFYYDFMRVKFPLHAFVAQLAARGSHNPKVAGSIPVESITDPQ